MRRRGSACGIRWNILAADDVETNENARRIG
jgi:hypothetical protein